MLTLWVVMNSVTVENSPVCLVDRSHKSGFRPTKPSAATGNSIGLAKPPVIHKNDQLCAIFEPAYATIHHCEVVHHLNHNQMEQPPLGLLFVYLGSHTEIESKLRPVYAAAQTTTPPG